MPVNPLPHISVCICTYKRSRLLRVLLQELVRQTTNGQFTYSLVVTDNDATGSAGEVVEEFREKHATPINFLVEPDRNIAKARNKCVANASGEYVAFIDDDEVPRQDWLLRLYQACETYRASGVLGPVKPYFAVKPPDWAVKAEFFDRPNSRDYASGTLVQPNQTGTGNTLIRRQVFDEFEVAFKPELGSGGEDIDFFRRAMDRGHRFVWSTEAVAFELIPQERARISFQLRRALLRGQGSLVSPSGRPLGVLKSIMACGWYALSLPVQLLRGRHVFLKYLVRFCDHFGKVTAFCGLKLVQEKYVGGEPDDAVAVDQLLGTQLQEKRVAKLS